MNFLTRIKDQMNDPRCRLGRAGKASVDADCLRELIYHFEGMESLDRAMSISPRQAASHILHDSVVAMYHNTKDPVLLLNVVMEALNPMVKQEVEDKQAKVYFREVTYKETQNG